MKELRDGPLPKDLEPYRAPDTVMEFVRRAFGSLGFDVSLDLAQLMLFLNGSSSLFSECFGSIITNPNIELAPPEELKEFIESIVVMRSPKYI
jgi:hypothetical protein